MARANSKIKIGIVEDFHGETQLIVRELKDAELNFEFEVASDEATFELLLSTFEPDIILTPYSLKSTNAVKLLKLAQGADVRVPFILLAFDLSEDIAIDLLSEGIEDYVQRSTLKRLPVAIRKALQRYKTELELRISESLYKEAQSIAKVGSWYMDSPTGELQWSDEMYAIHGMDKGPISIEKVRSLTIPEDHEDFDSSTKRLLEGEDTPLIYRIRINDAHELKYLLAKGKVTKNKAGEIVSLSGTVQDISDNITTQLELEKVQKSLIEAQRIAKIGNWEWDVGSEHVWWSEVMFEIYEVEQKPITKDDVKGFIHPEDREWVDELTYKDLGDDIEPVIEYRLQLRSGKVKHVVSSAKQVLDEGGKVIRLIGTLQDVTEKVETEQAQKASLIQRELTLQASKIGVWHWNMQNNDLVWDERCFEIYEIPTKQIAVEQFMELMVAEDREKVQSEIASALKSGSYQSEYRINTTTGVKHLHGRGKVSFNDDGAPVRMDGIIIDMTERHAMEEALRNSEQLFRDMAESITEVFWLTDWNLNEVLYVSPQYEKLYGLSVESLYEDSTTWSKAIHPDDRDRIASVFGERAIEGEYDEEYRLMMPDGQIKWVRDRAFPVYNADGSVSRVAGITEDITKQKLDKEQIETLSLVASETVNGVLIHKPDGTILWANKGFERITGYAPEEIIGKEPWSVVGGPETNQRLVQMTYEKLEAGKSFTSDNQLRHKDGYSVWVNVSFTPILDDFGNVTKVVSIGMDITKQKETERLQREMLQKLEKANKELRNQSES